MRYASTYCSLLSVLAACGTTGPAAPSQSITVLVTNNSCGFGRCMTLELRAFVWAFSNIPQLSWRGPLLGLIPPGQKCIQFPDSLILRVSGPDMNGNEQTTITEWRPDHPAGLFLVAVDGDVVRGVATQGQVDSMNAGIFPYHGNGPSIGETVTFVPGNAPGWQTTFPSTPQAMGTIARSTRCSP
jgi:hypothetical protein